MAGSTGPVAVSASGTSGVLQAANGARVGLQVYNTDTASTLYLTYGATSTTALYTVAIPPGGYFEMPYSQETDGSIETIYQGVVSGIWGGSPTGKAMMTETYIS
jgi:hypothetical protein